MKVNTSSLSTIQIVWLVIQHNRIQFLFIYQILDRLAAHVGTIIATYDNDTAVNNSTIIYQKMDAGIPIKLLGFRLTSIELMITQTGIDRGLKPMKFFCHSFNIAFGQEGVSREAVEAAARVANADGFIRALPQGYDTNIGDRGAKLSGGQRQRIAIARAVLKNPPILILDEATSALDTESERLVQDALSRLMESRTSLVIAHRLSTIRHADEIYVVQDGRIVEHGNHEDLVAKNGLYSHLCNLQDFT